MRATAQRFAAQLIAIAAFGRRSEEDRGQAGRRFFANFDACRTGKGIAADFTRSAIGIRGEIDIARGVELRTRDNPDRCQTAASDTAIARARSATATIAGEIDRGDGRATVDIERGLAPGAVAAIARRSRATVAMRRTGERIGDQRTTDNAETRCAPRTVSAGRPIAAQSIGQSGDIACAHQRTIGEDRSEAASSGAAQTKAGCAGAACPARSIGFENQRVVDCLPAAERAAALTGKCPGLRSSASAGAAIAARLTRAAGSARTAEAVGDQYRFTADRELTGIAAGDRECASRAGRALVGSPGAAASGARRDGATVARAADTAATRGQHGGVSRNRQPCAFFLRAVSLDIGRATQRVAAIPAKADSGIAADRIGRQLYRTVDCNGAEHGIDTRFAAGGVASRLSIAAARDRVECGASGQRDIANAFGENEDTPPLARTANPVCPRSVRACSARESGDIGQ